MNKDREEVQQMIFDFCEKLSEDRDIRYIDIVRGYAACFMSLLRFINVSDEKVKKITEELYEAYVKKNNK
jgi:hypothetical protein